MTLRLTEIHPSVVHFPIALLPASLALDAAGKATGDSGLSRAGAVLMPAALGGALVAAVAGVLAQGAGRFRDRESHEHLVTHRTLNTALTVAMAAMTVHRLRQRTPGPGYLLAGLAAVAAMGYSAYLGGRMTYEHGVGVAAAGGLRDETTIGEDSVGSVARNAVADVVRAEKETLEETARGEFVPSLRPSGA